MTEHDDLDRTIDVVARAMTSVDPSADLRKRVLARLDERPSSFWIWRVPSVAAAAVAILAIVIATRTSRPVHAPKSDGTTQPVAAAGQFPNSDQTVVVRTPVAPPATLARNGGAGRSRPSVMSAEAVAWRARAIPPLALPDAIVLDSIQPQPLAIALLEVKPLVMEPLSVAPLGVVAN